MTEAYLSLKPHSAMIEGIAVDPTQNRFQLSWNERGIDVHVPPARYVWRAVRHSFWRSTDKVAAMVYPFPFSFVVLTAAGCCVYVWKAPADSPIFTSPTSKWLSYLHSLLPSTRLIPARYQATVLCGQLWVIVFGGATVIHRFLLRRMLTYKGWLLEKNPQKPSLVTRVWSAVLRVCFIRPGIRRTDVYERCLPSLPLPSLQQTVSKYLSSARAIGHQREGDLSDWNEIRRTAESFLLNEGPALQRHLRLHHIWRPNYVTEWWTRNVLLSARASLALHSNYFTIPFATFTPTTIPTARAAVLTFYLVCLKQQLERRALPPLFTGPRGSVPISMEQLYLAFNTTRIPGREVDRLDHDDSEENSYVIVLNCGRIYQVPVRHPRTRRWLTPYQLEAVYKIILDEVEDDISTGRDESEEEDLEPQSPRTTKRRMYRLAESLLPALTAAPRSQWADIRSSFLLNDANNHKPLRAIEKALFVVSFDDRSTGGTARTSSGISVDGLDAECTSYLVGNGSNLWCDKSFNLVIRQDGRVGAHVEHSWCDSTSFLPLLEYVTGREEARSPYDANGHARQQPGDKKFAREDLEYLLAPKRLRFTLHKQLANSIREAHTALLTEVVSQLDLHVVRFDAYGKNLPKHLGLCPDSWMQMAIQLAYFHEHDHTLKQTYEAVALRTFARGRTDAIRSVSDESAAFVRAVAAPAEERRPREELLALLRAACEHHQEIAQEAFAGQGVDRHLFALYMVSAAQQAPSDFLNNVMRKTKWKVSSMQVRQRHLPTEYHAVADPRLFETPGCGFGPVAFDGYGVSYCYSADGVVYITVTCKKGCTTTSAKSFGKRLVEALETMAELVEVDVTTLPGQAMPLAEMPNALSTAHKSERFPW